jgi:hypothetical protein
MTSKRSRSKEREKMLDEKAEIGKYKLKERMKNLRNNKSGEEVVL